MKVKDKVQHMLDLQDSVNCQIDPDWKKAEYRWERYILVEAGELMEHYGFKHWKHQSSDMDQVKLEVVDIFHFILSMGLELETVCPLLTIEGGGSSVGDMDVLSNTSTLVQRCLCDQDTNPGGFSDTVNAFFILMSSVGMSFDDLYKLYIGKNILNGFRQDNGYKEGGYRKMWYVDGRLVEDNVALMGIVSPLHVDDRFVGSVKNRLQCLYSLNSVEV